MKPIKSIQCKDHLFTILLVSCILFLLAVTFLHHRNPAKYDILLSCETIPTPFFSVPEGLYDQPFELEITAPDGYTIYYTTDGSIPTINSRKFKTSITVDPQKNLNKKILSIPTTFLLKEPSWRRYQPIWKPPRGQQNHSTVIRARCFKNGLGYGKVENVIYSTPNIIQHHGFQVIHILIEADSLFSSKKGIYVLGDKYYNKQSRIYVENQFENIWGWAHYPANYSQSNKDWIRPAEFILIDSAGKSIFEQTVKIRMDGFSSRYFPLKAIRIIADGNRGDTVLHYPFFDYLSYETFKHIKLRNSSSDMPLTMFRDAMVQQTVRGVRDTKLDIQGYAPAVVYINGNYWGIHNIREKMDENYLAVKYDAPMEMIDLLILRETGFIYSNGDTLSLSSFYELIEFIKKNSFDNNEEAYQHVCSQMDIDNFIDYVIVETYYTNLDWITNNIKTYRINRQTEIMKEQSIEAGKWRWLLYDLDACLWSPELNMVERFKEDRFIHSDFSLIFNNLLENKLFREKFKSRYEYIITHYLTTEYVIQCIEYFEDLYQLEMERHIARWRYPGSIQIWRTNVEEMKDFIRKRPEIVLDQLKEL